MPRLAKNAGFLLVSQAASVGAAVVTLAFTARYLGVGRFGEQAVLRAAAVFVTPLLATGLQLQVVRNLGRDRDRTEAASVSFGLAHLLGFLLVLGGGLLGCALVSLLPLSRTYRLGGYAAVLLALSGVWDALPRAVFLAYELNQFNLVLSVASGVLCFLSTLVAIRWDAGVPGILVASALPVFVCAQGGLCWIYLRLLRPALALEPREMVGILRGSLVLGLSGVLQRAYTQVDVWLLAALRSAAAAGTFSMAYRVTVQAQGASILISSAVLPRLSRLARTSRDDLRTAFEHLLLALLTASVGAAGLVAAWAAPVVLFVVGPRFAASAGALRLLSVVLVSSLPSALLFFTLVSLGKDSVATGGLAVTVAANVLLDLALIPQLGVTGACFGTIAAEWVFVIYSLAQVHRALRLTSVWRCAGKPLAAGLPMLATSWWLGPHRPLVSATVGLGVYALSLLVLRALPRGLLGDLRRALAIPPMEQAPALVAASVPEQS
jgi:O-antigen/teichoic acid export membrane protein